MEPKTHEIADKIYEHFNGRCVLTWEVVQYVKRLGYKAPSRTTLAALKYLAANNKMHMYKIYKDYAIYCFGKEYNDENLFDHKEIRKCIEQHLPIQHRRHSRMCDREEGRRAQHNPAPRYAL